MLKRILGFTALVSTLLTSTVHATTQPITQVIIQQATQTLIDYQQLKFTPATTHFSGNARFAMLPSNPNSTDRRAMVEFAKGTITDWHSHSQGQYLIVTEGEGLTQEWGRTIRPIKKGDVIWCPPNVKHWHGATANSAMSHIAIAPNASQNQATWYEKVQLPTDLASMAKSNNMTTVYKAELQKIQQTTPLTVKQLAIVPIALLSEQGDLPRLTTALEQGLQAGLTVSELKELFAHQYAYAGFPRTLNGLLTLNSLLEERAKAGIYDVQGIPPTPLNSTNPDYYALGTEFLNTLSQRDNSAILWGFDGVDYALKAHLFGYLFSRDNFSPVNREIVTVAAIAGLQTAQAQLKSHFGHIHNLGVSKADLQKMIDEMAKIDQKTAQEAQAVLNQALP